MGASNEVPDGKNKCSFTCVDVVPHASDNIDWDAVGVPPRALTIGVAGTIALVFGHDRSTVVTFAATELAAGVLHPIGEIWRINAIGTTATNMKVWF